MLKPLDNSSSSSTTTINNIGSLINQIEQQLQLPITIDYSHHHPELVRGNCSDCSILSCGCLISENLANQLLMPHPSFNCPICGSPNTTILAPCENLRQISNIILKVKAQQEIPSNPKGISTSSSISRKNVPTMSLLAAFGEAFKEASGSMESNSPISQSQSHDSQSQSHSLGSTPRPIPQHNNSFNSYGTDSALGMSSFKNTDEIPEPTSQFLPSSPPTAISLESQQNSFSRPRARRKSSSYATSNLTRAAIQHELSILQKTVYL
ncbi:unnamed protein product [Ambrosiozyma monospora]|uniref:Unnamed protein product n=1 Tax=Ambrosiozyma monospora TaxID=43982 RepID=A0A9W7DJS3_AMBMO|nr:unnamed protein product [Ambrosiozyma monospora]